MDNREKQTVINEALGEFLHVMMWRRSLHQHPELSFEEHRTSKVVAEALQHEGIEYRSVAGTGVLARIEGTKACVGRERDALVLRADMDALPIAEATGLEFASVHKGVMHACGHDMHTAILLGALKILNRHRDLFCGTVFGLFQPGEELNPGGASLVMRERPFDGYRVAAFVGQHVEPMLKTGTFGFRRGKYMASSDELRFRVNGVGGHAALRERIKDPVRAAAELIRLLYDIPAANPSPELPTIVSIGRVTADGATNVVPDELYMEGTLRTFDEREREIIHRRIANIAADIDKRHGVRTDVGIGRGYPCVVNDEILVKRAVALAQETGLKVEMLPLRTTAEDFGFYCRIYPSLFYRLGVGAAAGRPHTSSFSPDEGAIDAGIGFMGRLALQILNRQ